MFRAFGNPVFLAFILSLCYLAYLINTASIVMAMDAVGYEYLGNLIATKGWLAYFQEGPNREPVYPLLISLSMLLGEKLSLSYQNIIIIAQVFILFLTQCLAYTLLQKLKISRMISAIVILYIGISPSLVNSAFSLFSEIATYPLILLIVLLCAECWDLINNNETAQTALKALILGVLLVLMTLSKGIFEFIAPILLLPFFCLMIKHFFDKKKSCAKTGIIFLIIVTSSFYSGIFAYKNLNKIHNGNFAITNRGAWALYGNTARRLDATTPKHFLSGLATMPGWGVCRKFFNKNDCEYWKHEQSDSLGITMESKLVNEGYQGNKLDKQLMKLSKQKILSNPPLYAVYYGIECIKMFFWESTKIGYVTYPTWLDNIFSFGPFKSALRLVIFLITFTSFVWSWLNFKKTSSPLIPFCLFLITIYISLYALFFALTRYSLPIAPLFLIIAAFYTQTYLIPRLKK